MVFSRLRNAACLDGLTHISPNKVFVQHETGRRGTSPNCSVKSFTGAVMEGY